MTTSFSTLSRRQLLAGAAGTLAAAPLIAGGLGLARAQTAAKPVRIAWNAGAVCSAPVGYAIDKGILAKHGLAGETVNFAGSTEQLLEAIATGKADAGVGMALRWLKPLEQGFDVKVVAGTHGGCIRLLGSKSAGATKLEDLKGKKIRVGGNVTGRIMAALGGTPVQLPPTEAQQAMQSGVADGITFPIESIEFFKITPVIKATTEIPGGLYTDTFWLGINEARWNSLTPEHKAAIEKHSGMAVAMNAGWAWTNGDEVGRAALRKNNVNFVTLPPAEVEKAKAALKELEEEWLVEAKKRNLPGEEIIAYARAMVDVYRAEKRVNVP